MHTKESLLELIKHGFILQRDTFDFFNEFQGFGPLELDTPMVIRPSRGNSSGSTTDIQLRVRDFALVDNRLPECLVHISEKQQEQEGLENPNFSLSSDAFEFMLSFWQESALVLPVSAFNVPPTGTFKDALFDKETITEPQHVATLKTFSYRLEKNKAFLSFSTFDLNKTKNGTLYAGISKAKIHKIGTAWLDANIPHWQDRVEVATSLNLTTEEVATHLFADYYQNQQDARRGTPRKTAHCENAEEDVVLPSSLIGF